MNQVARAISGELEVRAFHEVFVIRIDNWFDHKWLNFSGKGRELHSGTTREFLRTIQTLRSTHSTGKASTLRSPRLHRAES